MTIPVIIFSLIAIGVIILLIVKFISTKKNSTSVYDAPGMSGLDEQDTAGRDSSLRVNTNWEEEKQLPNSYGSVDFCPHCGVKIEEEQVKFCPNCGNDITTF
jgi:rubrerythrin